MAKVGTLGDETGYPEPGEPSRTGLRRFPRHARGAWRPLGEERDGVGENSRTGGPKRRRIVVLEEGTGRRCHGNNPTAWARGGPPSRVEGECEEAVKGYVYRCGPGEEDQTLTPDRVPCRNPRVYGESRNGWGVQIHDGGSPYRVNDPSGRRETSPAWGVSVETEGVVPRTVGPRDGSLGLGREGSRGTWVEEGGVITGRRAGRGGQ